MLDTKAQLEELLAELEHGLDEFAKAYIAARGTKYDESHFFSVDDAKHTAIMTLQRTGVQLPEITRFRIHFLLGVTRAVEPG